MISIFTISCLGYAKERNNGKKVFIATKINLKDTGCIINMGTIRPIIISIDGKTIKEISADIRKCDFRGCTVFGKFQNTKAKLEYTDDNLPREYIDRLINYKVPNDAVLTTTDVFIAMQEGGVVKGIQGLEKVKQMVDYNFTSINEKIWKYRKIIRDYQIDISYTGAFIYQYGMESIGRENYYIDLECRAKEAYINGDMDFVESVYKELDKETKSRLVGLALKDGKEMFVKKHRKDLKGIQKKYLEAKDIKGRVIEESVRLKDTLLQEYRKGKMVEFEIDMMKADVSLRSDIIGVVYKDGKLDLVQRYLDTITSKLKNEIFVAEYKKNNIDFVYSNFGKVDNGDLKDTILGKELRDNNYKFLYENYDYIHNQDLREKIIRNAYNEENVEFLNKHLADMPKSLKLEAAIKFKELKLSKVELAQLMKR